MPREEIFASTGPIDLLSATPPGSRAVLLDGLADDSWGDGRALFASHPRATLEAFASGWCRWSIGDSVRWSFGSPLSQWRRFLATAPSLASDIHDPEAAGFLTVLGYDLKHWIERLPRRHAWPAEPLLYCAFYDWLYDVDHLSGRGWLKVQSDRQLEARRRDLESAWWSRRDAEMRASDSVRVRPLLGRCEYVRMVERALQYIRAGDIYQVNLAQGFAVEDARIDSTVLFEALQRQYPMPFAAYVDGVDWRILSGSPECFLISDGSCVSTFPIKGTRRRATRVAIADAQRSMEAPFGDRAAFRSLADDPKERAEHVMIVDLERNDLGRVCEPGSIEVEELGVVRSYPLLEHMVSKVSGRLRKGTDLVDLIRAAFPGGSITGAPKIRAMEIIEELEPCARGFYTGAIGWSDLTGASRFNLMIRTAVQTGTTLSYHAGGGIVADSDPRREYEEILVKSQAFFRALANRERDSLADEPVAAIAEAGR